MNKYPMGELKVGEEIILEKPRVLVDIEHFVENDGNVYIGRVWMTETVKYRVIQNDWYTSLLIVGVISTRLEEYDGN
jgi:hypothetical protein